MAKKKKRGRRQGLFSKAINASLIALGFSRPIQLLLSQGPNTAIASIVRESTFGLSDGNFDLAAGLRMYTPGGAAVALGLLKSFLMKKFPVR